MRQLFFLLLVGFVPTMLGVQAPSYQNYSSQLFHEDHTEILEGYKYQSNKAILQKNLRGNRRIPEYQMIPNGSLIYLEGTVKGKTNQKDFFYGTVDSKLDLEHSSARDTITRLVEYPFKR